MSLLDLDDINGTLEWAKLNLLEYEYMLAMRLTTVLERESSLIARRFMEATARPLTAAATEIAKTSTMVAVYPSEDQQAKLAQAGGQPGDTIHCTLAFLGDTTESEFEALRRAMWNVAASQDGKLEGVVGGVASFAEGPDGYPSICLPDVPGLAELRHAVALACSDAGFDVASNHGWTPHLTLDYTDEASPPSEDLLGTPLTFAHLSVVRGDVMREDMPLSGVITAAAPPTWSIPPAGKVLNVTRLADQVEGATTGVRKKALSAFTRDLPTCALPGARTASRGKWDQEWVRSLSVDEEQATLDYRSETGGWFKKMNSLARGIVSKVPVSKIEETADRIALMDQAISKAQAPKDLVMYRGIANAKAVTGYLGRELQVGDEWRDLGFSSVSSSERVGGYFTDERKDSVMFEVHVPKGMRIAPIDKVANLQLYEREYVLPRGTKFRVIDEPRKTYSKYVGEVTVVKVEVVDDGYAGAAARASAARARRAKLSSPAGRKAAKAAKVKSSGKTARTIDGRTISIPEPPKFIGNPYVVHQKSTHWLRVWKDKNGVAPNPPGYLQGASKKAYIEKWRKRHGLTASGRRLDDGLGYDDTRPFGGRTGEDGVGERACSGSADGPESLVAAGKGCGPGETALKWDVHSKFYGKTLARTGEHIDAISQTVRKDMMGVMEGAYRDGLSVRDTASLLESRLGAAAEGHAEMIARTEMNRLANGASYNAVQVFQDVSGVQYHKVWLTAPGAAHPRHELDEGLNGLTVPMDQPFNVNGSELMYPGDPDGDPGETINCRCTLIYAETGEEIDTDSLMAAAGVASHENPTEVSSMGREALAAETEELAEDAMPCSDCGHAMSSHLDGEGECGADSCDCMSYARPDADEAVTAAADVTLPAEMQPVDTSTVPAPGPEVGGVPTAQWEMVMCPEGKATDDGRIMAPGSISWRTLPLSLMAMTETSEGGHVGAELAGRIDTIWREDGERMNLIKGSGVFDSGDYGSEIARLVEEQTLRGNSVDLAIREFEIGLRSVYVDDEGFWIGPDEAPEDGGVDLLDMLFGPDEEILFVVRDAVIGMSTVCPFPAFEEGTITLVAAGDDRMSFRCEGDFTALRLRVYGDGTTKLIADESLTASAAGLAPETPPAEWFEDPKLDALTPLTITDDGRVFGHAWAWDSCHTGFQNRCVTAPHSKVDYALFHLKEIEVDTGDKISCGTITLDAPHAPHSASRKEAMSHYDDTGSAVADVRAGEDEFGGWIAGSLRPDASAASVRKLRGAVLSGDWRDWEGNLELIGLLAVNIPGFPIPRQPVAMLASGSKGEEIVASLTSPGIVTRADVGERDKARLLALGARAEGGLAGLASLAASAGDCGCAS